jgi:uncharacterized protein YwqG
MSKDTMMRQLREQIEQAGLSRIMADLDGLALPSIRMTATRVSDGKVEMGGTKLGGTPDLPDDMEWPECNGVPMALLAQIRLQDVVPYDLDKRLPDWGVLYFFYEAAEQKWGFDPKDRGHWKVMYYDGNPAGLHATARPKNLLEESHFFECNVAFSNEMILPSSFSQAIRQLGLSDEERDNYESLPGGGDGEGEVLHHLLGHPQQIQNDMPLECQLVSNGLYMGDSRGYEDPRRPALEPGAADWLLLLQIDSDEENLGAMWGDVGRVYFWIRQQDLQKRDFSNVWLILQCY